MADLVVQETGGIYSSLNAAVVAASDGDRILISGTWINGDTTPVAAFDKAITIIAVSGSEHPGYYKDTGGTGHYRLGEGYTGASHLMENTGPGAGVQVSISGIVFKREGSTASAECLRVNNTTADTINISNCIFNGEDGTGNQQDGIYTVSAASNGTLNITQCMIYGFERGGIHLEATTDTVNINSCFIYNNGQGTDGGRGGITNNVSIAGTKTLTVYNTSCMNNGNGDFIDNGSETWDTSGVDYCIVSDGTITSATDGGAGNFENAVLTTDYNIATTGVIVYSVDANNPDCRLVNNDNNLARNMHGNAGSVPIRDMLGNNRPYDHGDYANIYLNRDYMVAYTGVDCGPHQKTPIIYTIGATNRDYSTINAWTADLDDWSGSGVQNSGAHYVNDDAVGLCYADSDLATNSTLVGEGDTLGLNHKLVTAAHGERHDGTEYAGVTIAGGAAHGIAIGSSYWTVEWVVIANVGNGNDDAININPIANENIQIQNNIVVQNRTTLNGNGIRTTNGVGNNDDAVGMYNNICYSAGLKARSVYEEAGIVSYEKTRVFNNTSYGWDINFALGGNTADDPLLINNVSASGLSSYHNFNRTSRSAQMGTGSCCNADLPGTGDLTFYDSPNSISGYDGDLQFVSTIDGFEDFHLSPSSILIEAGLDTSPSGIFDINRTNRSAQGDVPRWDIGAHQRYLKMTVGSAAGRDYSTVNSWALDLGDSGVYGAGSRAFAELYDDSVFDEHVDIDKGDVVDLGLIGLTVMPASGHTHGGVVGGGVEFAPTTVSPFFGSFYVNQNISVLVDISWLEINGSNSSLVRTGLYFNVSSGGTAHARNNIIHDLVSSANDSATGMRRPTGGGDCINNLIYNITNSNAGNRDVFGIVTNGVNTTSIIANNTIYGIRNNVATNIGDVVGISVKNDNHVSIFNNIIMRGLPTSGTGGEYTDFRTITQPIVIPFDANVTEDTSAASGSPTTSVINADKDVEFISTVVGLEDFNLGVSAQSRDMGLTLGGQSNEAHLDLSNVNRNTFNPPWDAGAYEGQFLFIEGSGLFPTITFDNATGDDVNSGAGPAIAITGTAASFSGNTITLDGSPSLTGVSADGDHVIRLETDSGTQFFVIDGVQDDLDQLTVVRTPAGTASGLNWGIGGALSGVVGNSSLWDDLRVGWTVDFLDTGTSYKFEAGESIVFNSVGAGDLTNSWLGDEPERYPVTFTCSNGRATLEINHTNTTPGSTFDWFSTSKHNGSWIVENLKFIGNQWVNFFSGPEVGSRCNFHFRNVEIVATLHSDFNYALRMNHNSTSPQTWTVEDCMISGMAGITDTIASQHKVCTLFVNRCLFIDSGHSSLGVIILGNHHSIITNNVFKNSTGPALKIGVTSSQGCAKIIHNNVFYNSATSDLFSGSTFDLETLSLYGNISHSAANYFVDMNDLTLIDPNISMIDFNHVYNAGSGSYNGFVNTPANDTSGDPLFTDVSNNDFSLQEGSPARNVGIYNVNNFITNWDQTLDMGAYQVATSGAGETVVVVKTKRFI